MVAARENMLVRPCACRHHAPPQHASVLCPHECRGTRVQEPSAILLSCGASLHAADRDGRTAIHHCIPGYTTNITHLFWFNGASKGDVPALRRLLGQQIGSAGDEGWKEVRTHTHNGRFAPLPCAAAVRYVPGRASRVLDVARPKRA